MEPLFSISFRHFYRSRHCSQTNSLQYVDTVNTVSRQQIVFTYYIDSIYVNTETPTVADGKLRTRSVYNIIALSIFQ